MSEGRAKPSKVGIRNVAEVAGVSITTVSHALNGKGRLPRATRDHVRQVAAELGYRPDARARSLVTGKTGVLGLVLSSGSEVPLVLSGLSYFVELIGSAMATALEHGYSLVLAMPTKGDPFPDLEVEGSIVVDPVAGDPSFRALSQRGPVVTTGRSPDVPSEYYVDNDHRQATKRVLEHLHRRGAERIATIRYPLRTSFSMDVSSAYDEWCKERGLTPLVADASRDLSEASGFAAATELLARETPPDAIYAPLDRLAVGTLLAASAQGVKVPDDLMIAGGTDSHASRWARPPLTVLGLDPQKIGRLAVTMLVDLVEGREPPHPQIVPVRMIARSSTRRPVAVRA